MIDTRTAFAALAVVAAAVPAHADITISTAATQNMSCSGGTCVPTATQAVLNATDLENDLSRFGNVAVMTTGNGVEANNIVAKAAFSSPDSTSLTLEAHSAITINAPVFIGSGTAELELVSETGGELGTISFGRKGHITFGSLSDVFGINGSIFTLVNSVQGLASAVAANPSGAFAFAADYDAGQDGTYSSAPIQTVFSGSFEGLGHRISNLTIYDKNADLVGLFVEVENATVRDIRLVDANMTAEGGGNLGAVAAGACGGSLINVQSVHGTLYGGEGEVGGSIVGGLVAGLGDDYACHGGTILRSSASGSVVDAGPEGSAGGLVGEIDAGTIGFSHSSASVSAPYGGAGGLVGVMYSFTGTSGIDQS